MKPDTLSFYARSIHDSVERIANALDEALDLAPLAKSAALSPFHFHRVFRGMVGETALELHRRLRLERAAWQLLTTDHPVTRIAFDAGYETHESFTRAFGAHFAASPSEFRAKRGESHGLPPHFTLAARCGVHFSPEPRPVVVRFVHGVAPMNVDIVERPALRCATIRHIGPYNRISEAFAKLGGIAGPAGLFGPQTRMLAIYHDAPEETPESELRSDAALSVAPDAVIPAGLVEIDIPAGRYACTVHKGPYDTIGDTWARLMGEWVPQHGHRVADCPAYEVYVNNPGNAKPDELLTELYIPLA